MTKRKRLGGPESPSSATGSSSAALARKEPALLSSNWRQLQAVGVADLPSFLNLRAATTVVSVSRTVSHVLPAVFLPQAERPGYELCFNYLKLSFTASQMLSLRETLVNKRKGPNARQRIKTETTAATGTDAKNWNGARFNLLPTSTDQSVTRVLALDCEMVGVGAEGKRNALARVSIVNVWGNVVYDKHVRPPEFVTDFRTQLSGVRPCDLRKAEDFFTVQKEVSDMLKNRILVGHALHNDLKVLLLSHPRKNIRDTQRYGLFRSDKGRRQSLKHLAELHLGAKIQQKKHDSVQDARAALYLYQQSADAWEENIKQGRKTSKYAQPSIT